MNSNRKVIENAIDSAATRYINGCEQRVDAFVRKHYSFGGSLKIHAHAFGWDLLKVPANIALSLFGVVFSLIAFVCEKLHLHKACALIRKIPFSFPTDMDRHISRLIVTEILQLPDFYGSCTGSKDALMAEITKSHELQNIFNAELNKFSDTIINKDFRIRLDEKLSEYSAARMGSSDLAANLTLLITSKASLGQASFGALSGGSAVSASVANSIAISNFWLGSTAGSYYYAVVPAAASKGLFLAVTASVVLVLSIFATFIGVVTDPIKAKIGLHQRSLRKLVSAVRIDLSGSSQNNFNLREKYVGRLLDALDLLSTVAREYK